MLERFNFTGSFLALMLLGGVQAAFGHANGNSKITLKLVNPDSLEITVDVNGDDLMNVTEANLNLNRPTLESILSYQNRAANYMLSRVDLALDKIPLNGGLRVLRWKKDGRGPEDILDSASLYTSTHVITFGGRLPTPRRTLLMGVNLFPELGVEPISEVSLFWKDTLLIRKWLGLDRTLKISLSPDSVSAMLERARQPAASLHSGEGLFLRFVTLGFTHILPHGLDHILFVLGLFFFSTLMRPLFFQITAFTVAHSITLGLSMLGVLALPSRVVEPLIALSIAVVAVENIFFRNVRASRWLIVFSFGLVHGLGFAGALRQLGIPAGRFWSTLAGFNLGVELGQITVVTLAFALTRWFWYKPWYFKAVTIPVSSLIAVTGLYWAVQRIFAF